MVTIMTTSDVTRERDEVLLVALVQLDQEAFDSDHFSGEDKKALAIITKPRQVRTDHESIRSQRGREPRVINECRSSQKQDRAKQDRCKGIDKSDSCKERDRGG